MIRFFFIFFFSFFFVVSEPAYASCSTRLQTESNLQTNGVVEGTDGIIAYLKLLVEEHQVSPAQLEQFGMALQAGKLKNLIPEKDAKISSTAFLHRSGIQSYLDHTKIDREKLLNWVNITLRQTQVRQTEREAVKEETKSNFVKTEFNAVPAGIFTMGASNGPSEEEAWAFEMMSTPVTQWQWVEQMGRNPSHFKTGVDSITVSVEGNDVVLQPNHPVESVTRWSAIVFANRLSTKHGLQPAYDTTGVTFDSTTSAEAGTLKSISGKLRFNSSDGSIERTEGYRLPTRREAEYVRRELGVPSDDNYKTNQTNCDLDIICWYNKNADRQTHAVGELAPLMISGQAFYDLYGNVSEWSNDLESWRSTQSRAKYWVTGGDFHTLAQNIFPGFAWSYSDEERFDNIGFRLVRTTPVPVQVSLPRFPVIRSAIGTLQRAVTGSRMRLESSVVDDGN